MKAEEGVEREDGELWGDLGLKPFGGSLDDVTESELQLASTREHGGNSFFFRDSTIFLRYLEDLTISGNISYGITYDISYDLAKGLGSCTSCVCFLPLPSPSLKRVLVRSGRPSCFSEGLDASRRKLLVRWLLLLTRVTTVPRTLVHLQEGLHEACSKYSHCSFQQVFLPFAISLLRYF